MNQIPIYLGGKFASDVEDILLERIRNIKEQISQNSLRGSPIIEGETLLIFDILLSILGTTVCKKRLNLTC